MAAVYQLIVSGHGGGEFVQNVLHFRLSEGGSGSHFEYARELCAAFAPVLTAWEACIAATFEFTSLRAKRITGSGGPTAVVTFAAGAQTGSVGSTIGDTAQCLVFEFPVALNGKNVTGKLFMSGITKEDIEENRPSSSVEASAATFLTTLISGLTLSGALGTADFTIYNRANTLDALATVGYVSPVIGTQRRRLHPV